MKISDFLLPADVVIDSSASDKQKLLLELGRRSGAAFHLSPDHIAAELSKREQLGSTGMGGGVAIPHARFHQVKTPYGMLVRLRKPIDFEALDGKPVDLAFLLLLPEAVEGAQLSALALTARKLRDPAIAAALRQARDCTEIYRVLLAD
jgi:nitrogen PTS system EIIA component